MRAWKLTAALAFTALLAAGLAPTLFAEKTCSEPVPVQAAVPEVIEVATVPPTPVVPVKVMQAPVLPEIVKKPTVRTPPAKRPRPLPPKRPRTHAPAPMPSSLIPELDNPITPTVTPAEPPPPDKFWDNCPNCGMG